LGVSTEGSSGQMSSKTAREGKKEVRRFAECLYEASLGGISKRKTWAGTSSRGMRRGA